MTVPWLPSAWTRLIRKLFTLGTRATAAIFPSAAVATNRTFAASLGAMDIRAPFAQASAVNRSIWPAAVTEYTSITFECVASVITAPDADCESVVPHTTHGGVSPPLEKV